MAVEDRPIGVLLVDDSQAMLWGLGKLIESEFPRMALVGTASTGEEALAQACRRPDVSVINLELSGYSSIELIPMIRQKSGGGVLIHTGLGDRRLHEDAMLFGAHGVVGKGSPGETLLQAIECVHGGQFWNLDPAAIPAQPRSPEQAAPGSDDIAALGIGFLSPIERQLIIGLAIQWHDRSNIAGPPLLLGQLVSIYNKLGLRNRVELVRFAARHGLDRFVE